MKTKINSIAVYGSKARMDDDIYSDNDLLIVSEKFENKYEAEQMFNNVGYSCSAYTFDKLQVLSDRKALFVQHLKQDAKIITDKNDRLYTLLNDYSPKENYDSEIQEINDYFELIKCIPDTVEGIGWAFDVIAIGLRNYNILQLANHKIYEFSLHSILKYSKRIFNLTESEIQTLLNTRIAKKNYREKKYRLLPPKHELLRTVSIIEKRYGFSITPVFLSKDVFSQYAFEKVYADEMISAYQKLRFFEAYIMTLPIIKNCIIRDKCRRIIESPKFYVSSFFDQNYIDNLLVEITT